MNESPAWVDLRGARLESIGSGRGGAVVLELTDVRAYYASGRGLVNHDVYLASLHIELLETVSFSWVRSLADKADFITDGSFKGEDGRDVPIAAHVGQNLPGRSLEVNFKSGATARFKYGSARVGALERRERQGEYDGPLPPLK